MLLKNFVQTHLQHTDLFFTQDFYNSFAETTVHMDRMYLAHQVSRGIDIPELERVVVALPAYVPLRMIGITHQTLTQMAGRVGRSGRAGTVDIVFYGLVDNNADESTIDKRVLGLI